MNGKMPGLLLALLALLPGLAFAQVRTVCPALVTRDPALEGRSLELAQSLDEALRADPRFDVVDLAGLARAQAAPGQEKVQKGATLLKEGIALFDRMAFPAALEKLDEAIALFEGSDLSEGMTGLLDSRAAKALVLSATGQKAEAGNEFSRLFVLKPTYRIDPRRSTPEAAALAESVRKRLEKAPRAVLEITTAPVPAVVYFDGEPRGISPLKLEGIIPGDHYLTLSAPGYELEQVKHLVGPTPASVQLKTAGRGREMLAHLQEIRLGFGPGNLPSAGGALARWAKVDEVVAVFAEQRKEGLWLRAARIASDGHVLARHEVAWAEGQMAPLVSQLFLKDLPRPPKTVTPPVVAESSSSGQRILGYTLMGVAVAAAGTGGWMGWTARTQAAEARESLQLDYQDKADSARNTGYLADGLFAGALVSAGVGLVLVLTGADEPTPPAVNVGAAPIPGGAALSLTGEF